MIKKIMLKKIVFVITFLFFIINSFGAIPIVNDVSIIYNTSTNNFQTYVNSSDGDNDNLTYEYQFYYNNGTNYYDNWWFTDDYENVFISTNFDYQNSGSVHNLGNSHDGNTGTYAYVNSNYEWFITKSLFTMPYNYVTGQPVYGSDVQYTGYLQLDSSCVSEIQEIGGIYLGAYAKYVYNSFRGYSYSLHYASCYYNNGTSSRNFFYDSTTAYSHRIYGQVARYPVSHFDLPDINYSIKNITAYDDLPIISIRAYDGTNYSNWSNSTLADLTSGVYLSLTPTIKQYYNDSNFTSYIYLNNYTKIDSGSEVFNPMSLFKYTYSGNISSYPNKYDGVINGYTFASDDDTSHIVSGVSINNQGSYAMDFDGVNDFINLSNYSNNLSLTDISQSFSFWIKTDKNDTYIFGNKNTSNGGISIFVNNSGNIGITKGIVNNTGSTTIVSNNEWHQVVLEYNTTSYNLYIDGILDYQDNSLSGTISLSDIIYIGNSNDGKYYDGLIDDFRIFNKSLISTEVSNLFNGTYHNSSNLVLHYTFEELENNKIHDKNIQTCKDCGNETINYDINRDGIYTNWFLNDYDNDTISQVYEIDDYNITMANIRPSQAFIWSNLTVSCEDLTDLNKYNESYYYIWTNSTNTLLEGYNETSLYCPIYSECSQDIVINVTCRAESDYLNISQSKNVTILDVIPSFEINSKTSIEHIMLPNSTSSFSISLSQDIETDLNYTISSNENSSIFNISLNQTSISLSDTNSINLELNITSNGIYVNNSLFNLTLTRDIDSQNTTILLNITIVDDVAVLEIDPYTNWIDNILSNGDSSYSTNISNTGNYNASLCNFVSGNGLNDYLESNLGSNFSLAINETLEVDLNISDVASGLYSDSITLTCLNATSNENSISSSQSIPYLILVTQYQQPVVPSGGGSTPIIQDEEDDEDDADKLICNINVNFNEINISDLNLIIKLEILNMEDFPIYPRFQFISDNLNDTVFSKLEFINMPSVINKLQTEVVGIEFSDFSIVGNSTGIVKITTDKCKNIIIPININVTGSKNIGSKLNAIISGNEPIKTFFREISNARIIGTFEGLLAKLDSVLGLSIIIIMIVAFFIVPSSGDNRLNQSRFLDILIRLILLIIIFIFIVIVIWTIQIG